MIAAKRQVVWTVLIILIGFTDLSQAKIYHVATNGNDANSGTLSSPFQTIQKAASLAQPGDVVSIRGGVYRETVTPAHSGISDAPITYTTHDSKEVVISGGDLIAGWSKHRGNIWKVSVPWNANANGTGNTLFVEGELKFEAREGGDNDPLDFGKWGQIPRGRLTPDYLIAEDLKGWGDDYWNGAKIRNHQNDWTITTSIIADYDSETGKITFAAPIGVVSQKHVLGYTIYDTLKALDQAGEWFKDQATDTLYYQVSSGQNPNDLEAEFKRRDYGFDVRGRDYIRIHNLTFRGVSIRTDSGTAHNLWDGNVFYAYDKANYGRFWISGNSNVFRDNEVRQTWGSVVSVNGMRHQLVNNYFHDIGYNGTSRVITMSGSEHLVSHNTVRRFARSFLDGFPYRSEFACNLFEDGARLSWDTGVFDGDAGRGNGGGSIVHHNVFRNTKSIGIYKAFYSGTDLVVHHNIVYDLTPSTLRTGYLNFLKYYHNTLIGEAPRGDVNAGDYTVESNYNNNLQIAADNITSIGVNCRGNHNYKPSDFVDFEGRDLRLAAGSGAIDVGIVLPGINDGYSGAAPDAGALEYGQRMWKVGHDFSDPPNPEFGWVPLPGTNLFGDGQFSQPPTGWIETGTPVWFSGNAWNTGGTGLSRIGGRCIQLNPGDGIRRIFTQLKPNTWYTVASETRLVDQRIDAEQFGDSQGEIASASHRGEDYVSGLAEGDWLRYDNIDFGAAGKYDLLELTYTRPPGTTPGSDAATLEVRSGSPTGQLLGEFEYNPNVIDSWYASRIHIPALSGKHSIYLLGKGEGAAV